MADILSTINTRTTLQTERARPDQVKNHAGGYGFTLDPRAQLRRFLTIGTTSGTYYVNAKDLTVENAAMVMELARTDGAYLVEEIVRISTEGRAPKPNPALFALAIASVAGDLDTRKAAYTAIEKVCRTGTHLFTFAGYREQFGGWSRGLRNAVSDWYLSKPVNDLAYQVVKYRQRNGWSHRDLLRLAHPRPEDAARRSLFDWVSKREADLSGLPLVEGFMKAQEIGADVPALVRQYRLSWEMLPDDALTTADTWDALIDNGMPMTALIRQLPRLTRLGLLPAIGGRTNEVIERITNQEYLQKARIHPMNVLLAHKTYEQGVSLRGSSTWTPTAKVVDALDAAFYQAFGNVEPTGKRTMLALDVSGSMGWSAVDGLPINAREVSAALALVTASVEKDYLITGFSTQFVELPISPRQRLSDVVRTISGLPFGGTDCALPILAADQNRDWGIESFAVYTDSETYAGRIHPHQALEQYRANTGIPARSVVVGITSTGFSIADPKDAGQLDVAGFDSAVPQLISNFFTDNSAGVQ